MPSSGPGLVTYCSMELFLLSCYERFPLPTSTTLKLSCQPVQPGEGSRGLWRGAVPEPRNRIQYSGFGSNETRCEPAGQKLGVDKAEALGPRNSSEEVEGKRTDHTMSFSLGSSIHPPLIKRSCWYQSRRKQIRCWKAALQVPGRTGEWTPALIWAVGLLL